MPLPSWRAVTLNTKPALVVSNHDLAFSKCNKTIILLPLLAVRRLEACSSE